VVWSQASINRKIWEEMCFKNIGELSWSHLNSRMIENGCAGWNDMAPIDRVFKKLNNEGILHDYRAEIRFPDLYVTWTVNDRFAILDPLGSTKIAQKKRLSGSVTLCLPAMLEGFAYEDPEQAAMLALVHTT
jgi:hypothetical protein